MVSALSEKTVCLPPSSSSFSSVRCSSSPRASCDLKREQYITRLPSSSLLSQPLTTEPNIEAPQYGSVDLITLKINSEHENKLVRLLGDHIPSLPENVSWFVAKSTEEEGTWLVLETQLSAQRIPTSPTTTTGPSVGMDQTGPADDVSVARQLRGINRQSSRFIEAFRTSSVGRNPLSDLLSDATSVTSSPAEMARARMIVAPLASHTKQVGPTKAGQPAVSRSLLSSNSSGFESYLVVILETAKTKRGQPLAYIDSCIALDSSLSSVSESETGLVAIEVHQDLELSSNGRLFTVMYYFTSEDGAKAFRQSRLWKRWRSSVAHLLEGPPRLQFLQGVFDSRAELRAFAYGDRDKMITNEISTSPDSGVDFLSSQSRLEAASEVTVLSPTSIVSHVRDAITKRIATTQSPSSLEVLSTKPSDGTAVVARDIRLEPFTDFLRERFAKYLSKKNSVLHLPINGKIDRNSFSLLQTVHKHFGLWRYENGYILRDWIPSNAKEVYLMGDFNAWDRTSYPLSKDPPELYGEDVWSITLRDFSEGNPVLRHKMKYKLHIITNDGREIERVPPSAFLVWRSHDEDTKAELYDAAVWNPPESECYISKHASPLCPVAPKMYEAYVGLSSRESRFGTYNEFRMNVLPRIHRSGYDTLVLVGIPQHLLNSVGWDVTNFYAPTSEFGTPEEFKELIDAAHALGIYVVLSVIQSHASQSTSAGLNEIDGTEEGFFRAGAAGNHPQWNSRLFDYAKPEVCRFLLCQLSYFMCEYKIDGFRFEGLTSMLFHHHGIGRDSHDYNDFGRYFSFEANDEAATYLMLANDFVHSICCPNRVALTIGTDHFRVPILAHEVSQGGLGFDYRMAPHIADEWVRQLSHSDDAEMDMVALVNAIELRSPLEKTVAAAETLTNSLRSRRRLKIAMLAWESLHTHAVGGVAPHVTELSAGLGRLGHEVHVFVRAVGTVAQHSVQYGVHYHECPFNLNSDFVQETQNMCNSFIGHLNATEQYMGQMFDICHAHDWLATKAIVQAKHQGHSCIQTMHSTEFGRCGNNIYGGESRRISDIEREGCHISDRIICVSEVLANEVSHLFAVHREKIKVIYNGINACNFDGFEDAAPIKARYGIQAMDPMFLFVGRMAIQKGPDLLVEAIPFILKFRSDVKFVLVGDGHMKPGLISRANQLGVGHACRFLGVKTGGELKSLFKACDAVVVPSRNEPFGIVVLEGWSAYKPVVATTCGGPRDFVTPNVDGFLVDPNGSSIAWGCCEILKNFDHAKWMGERGRVKAAFSFSWDQIAKTTESVYYEQLNKHDSPHCEGGLGGCSLAYRLMGPAVFDRMGVFDQNDVISRGLALHKMIRLMTFALGGEAYLNFMGNEFGHPEFIDVPRPGNNFSFHHSNRRFELANDKLLKYKHLEFFDASMIRLDRGCKFLSSQYQFVSVKNQDDKVIAFERGSCLFVFNFHPHQSYEGYQVGHSIGKDLVIILDTDDIRFGGFNRLSAGYHNPFPTLESFNSRFYSVKLYLPCRTGMVLAPLSLDLKDFRLADPIFPIENVDEFVDKLEKNF